MIAEVAEQLVFGVAEQSPVLGFEGDVRRIKRIEDSGASVSRDARHEAKPECALMDLQDVEKTLQRLLNARKQSVISRREDQRSVVFVYQQNHRTALEFRQAGCQLLLKTLFVRGQNKSERFERKLQLFS